MGCFLTSVDGRNVSYFRGRKLHGKTVKIPEGYKGVILSSTDKKLPKDPQTSEEDEEVDENEQPEHIGILEEQAEFDEVMVWGHEALPDEITDPYVRAVEEWIAFAEQVGSEPRSQRSTDNLRCIHILHRKAKIRSDPNNLDLDIWRSTAHILPQFPTGRRPKSSNSILSAALGPVEYSQLYQNLVGNHVQREARQRPSYWPGWIA